MTLDGFGDTQFRSFAIDPKTPTNLKAVGQPISSGGEVRCFLSRFSDMG